MATSFGYGQRFKKLEAPNTPGPGSYDPKALQDVGFKVDPKINGSAQRFSSQHSSQELEQCFPERPPTPTRQRSIVAPGAQRKFSWTSQRIYELQREVASSNDKCKDLEHAVKTHAGQLDSLKLQLEHAERALCEANQSREQLLGQLQELTGAHAAQTLESRATIEQLQTRVLRQKNELGVFRQDLRATQDRLTEAMDAADSLKQQLSQSANESQQLQQHVSELMQQLQDKSSAVSLAQQELLQNSDTIAQLSSTLQQSEAALHTMQGKMRHLAQELRVSQQESAASHAEAQSLSAQVALLHREQAALQHQAASVQASLQDSLLGCEQQLGRDSEFVGGVEGTVAQLGHVMEAAAALTREHGLVSTALQHQTAEAGRLQQDVERLQQVVADRDGAILQLTGVQTALQQQLQQLAGEHTQVQASLAATTSRAEQVAGELDSTRTELQAALEELASQKEENYSLAAEISKLQAEVGDKQVLQQEVASMRGELGGAYQQLSTHQARERALQDQVSSLQARLAEVQLRESSVDHQVVTLQELLEGEKQLVEAATQRAQEAEAKAQQMQMAVLEMQRLVDDNELLANRLEQMELDLKELLASSSGTGNLGHNNPKQKIQYHLRLKQELEELRSKCTSLLRDKFHLEQCVRYLSVRARLVEECGMMGGQRKATEVLQPDSLAPTHLTATLLSSKAGRTSFRSRTSHRTREEMEEQIASSRRQLVKELESWKQSGADAAAPAEATSPQIGTQPATASPHHSASPSPRGGPATPAGRLPGLGSLLGDASSILAGDDAVEKRIMARVASVLSPVTNRPASSHISRQNSLAAATLRDDAVAVSAAALEASPTPASVAGGTATEASREMWRLSPDPAEQEQQKDTRVPRSPSTSQPVLGGTLKGALQSRIPRAPSAWEK